jgi:hypothetical protein
VNGTHLGKCFDVPQESLEGQALFPHILSKNCEFEVNFGQQVCVSVAINELCNAATVCQVAWFNLVVKGYV